MTKLMTNKDRLDGLTKKELLAICKEQIKIYNRNRSKAVYNPFQSKQNNLRRALRKYLYIRHSSDTAKYKIADKIARLRDLEKEL